MKKDEEAVERLVSGLNEWVPDLWSPSQPLAPSIMVQNVLSAKDRGMKAKEEFILGNKNFQQWEASFTFSQRSTSQRLYGQPYLGCRATSTEAKPYIYNYMDPIMKQPVQTFGSLGIDKTKVSIIEDERHSYGALLAEFDKKKLDMQAVMDWPITSKPRSM